jgi:signal transduction histidine kinase
MWFGIQIAAYVSIALGYALLLFMVVRHRVGRERAQNLLETTILLAGLWTLALGIIAALSTGGWWDIVLRRVAFIGLVVLTWLTADFASAFVRRSARHNLRRGAVFLLVLSAVALDIVPFIVPIPDRHVSLVGPAPSQLATWLLVVAWSLSSMAAWWGGITELRRSTGSKHLNRIRYLLASLLCFFVGDLLILFDGIPDVQVGLASRLLGFCILAFATLRYDLLDIKRFSLLSIRFVALSGLTFLLYLVALLSASHVSGTMPELPRLAVVAPSVGFALLVAAGADVFLGPRLHRLFDRAFLGQSHDIQKALRAYSRQVNLVLDLERLAGLALSWLQTTMDVQRSAFILLTPVSNAQVELRVLCTTTGSLTNAKRFRSENRFIAHFCRIGRPLSQYDLDMLSWFQVMPADERQWLKELDLDLYIPVLVADRPVALLALGPKAGGRPYSDGDLETLMILASQTGTALENARLVDDLRAVQGDLHRLSTELAETNEHLKRLDDAKADFVAIASHELRTPLTQIYGYSDILTRLESDELSDAQVVHQFIDGITRGASRLKRVLDAMLDVSLIETGALTIRPEPVYVESVVEAALHMLRDAARRRGLTITVHDLSELPHIQADGARVQQVFASLLSNAIKFTPDGGTIKISGCFSPTRSQQAWLEVQVADNGIGVDQDQRDLIFEKFYRAENLLRHSSDEVGFKGAGPGLGLAIAKGIVEAHGGRIWVESLGRDEEHCPGSTFHVRLPVDGPTDE